MKIIKQNGTFTLIRFCFLGGELNDCKHMKINNGRYRGDIDVLDSNNDVYGESNNKVWWESMYITGGAIPPWVSLSRNPVPYFNDSFY